MIPSGVHATSAAVPWSSRPALIGCRPSTSFAGRSRARSLRVELLRQRQLDQDPVDVLRAVQLGERRVELGRRGRSGRCVSVESIPMLSHARRLPLM
jgi:hypothetical protein